MNHPTQTVCTPSEVLSEAPSESPVIHPAIDPWRVPKTAQAEQLVNRVITMVLDHESQNSLRTRARKRQDQATFLRQVSMTVANLAIHCLSRSTTPIRVSRSNRVLGATDRYSAPTCFTNAYREALDALSAPEVGLLMQILGDSYRSSKRLLMQTCIVPTERFRNLLDEHGLGLDDFTRDFQGEVIALKSKKHRDHFNDDPTATLIEYDDNEETLRLRREMHEINSWLRQADLEFDEALSEKFVDTHKVQLRRIFNNGNTTLAEGGRLFGGFWQQISKEKRKQGLSINGNRTVSLDYGQIAPRILYWMADVVPAFEDAYAIPGLDSDKWRSVIKQVFNAMTFKAKDIKKIPKGITWPDHNVRIRELVTRIRLHHHPIQHFLCTQIGHKISRIESDIMVAVLLSLKARGVVGLPVHDCVIVEEQYEAIARSAMQEAFMKYLGFDAVVEKE